MVNRRRERYAEYADYIDHHQHRVTYVSTEVGLAAVPETAAEVAIVKATDDQRTAAAFRVEARPLI